MKIEYNYFSENISIKCKTYHNMSHSHLRVIQSLDGISGIRDLLEQMCLLKTLNLHIYQEKRVSPLAQAKRLYSPF